MTATPGLPTASSASAKYRQIARKKRTKRKSVINFDDIEVVPNSLQRFRLTPTPRSSELRVENSSAAKFTGLLVPGSNGRKAVTTAISDKSSLSLSLSLGKEQQQGEDIGAATRATTNPQTKQAKVAESTSKSKALQEATTSPKSKNATLPRGAENNAMEYALVLAPHSSNGAKKTVAPTSGGLEKITSKIALLDIREKAPKRPTSGVENRPEKRPQATLPKQRGYAQTEGRTSAAMSERWGQHAHKGPTFVALQGTQPSPALATSARTKNPTIIVPGSTLGAFPASKKSTKLPAPSSGMTVKAPAPALQASKTLVVPAAVAEEKTLLTKPVPRKPDPPAPLVRGSTLSSLLHLNSTEDSKPTHQPLATEGHVVAATKQTLSKKKKLLLRKQEEDNENPQALKHRLHDVDESAQAPKWYTVNGQSKDSLVECVESTAAKNGDGVVASLSSPGNWKVVALASTKANEARLADEGLCGEDTLLCDLGEHKNVVTIVEDVVDPPLVTHSECVLGTCSGEGCSSVVVLTAESFQLDFMKSAPSCIARLIPDAHKPHNYQLHVVGTQARVEEFVEAFRDWLRPLRLDDDVSNPSGGDGEDSSSSISLSTKKRLASKTATKGKKRKGPPPPTDSMITGQRPAKMKPPPPPPRAKAAAAKEDALSQSCFGSTSSASQESGDAKASKSNPNEAISKLMYESFKQKMLKIYVFEFARFEIGFQLCMSSLWLAHKRDFGSTCDESCRCVLSLSKLAGGVVDFYLAHQLRHSAPGWQPPARLQRCNLGETPTGFCSRFSVKFIPLLLDKWKEDKPLDTLRRLCRMWQSHLAQRNFGMRCKQNCMCTEGWKLVFNEGEEKLKRRRKMPPPIPVADSSLPISRIPRKKAPPAPPTDRTSTKSGQSSNERGRGMEETKAAAEEEAERKALDLATRQADIVRAADLRQASMRETIRSLGGARVEEAPSRVPLSGSSGQSSSEGAKERGLLIAPLPAAKRAKRVHFSCDTEGENQDNRVGGSKEICASESNGTTTVVEDSRPAADLPVASSKTRKQVSADEVNPQAQLLTSFLRACSSKTNEWKSQRAVEQHFQTENNLLDDRQPLRRLRMKVTSDGLVEWGRQFLQISSTPVKRQYKPKPGYSEKCYLRLSEAGAAVLAVALDRDKEETAKNDEDLSADFLRLFLQALGGNDWMRLSQLTFVKPMGRPNQDDFIFIRKLAFRKGLVTHGIQHVSAGVVVCPENVFNQSLDQFLRLTSAGRTFLARYLALRKVEPTMIATTCGVEGDLPLIERAWFVTGGSRTACDRFKNVLNYGCFKNCQYLHLQPRLGSIVDNQGLHFQKLAIDSIQVERGVNNRGQSWWTCVYRDTLNTIFRPEGGKHSRFDKQTDTYWYPAEEGARRAVSRVFAASKLAPAQIFALAKKQNTKVGVGASNYYGKGNYDIVGHYGPTTLPSDTVGHYGPALPTLSTSAAATATATATTTSTATATATTEFKFDMMLFDEEEVLLESTSTPNELDIMLWHEDFKKLIELASKVKNIMNGSAPSPAPAPSMNGDNLEATQVVSAVTRIQEHLTSSPSYASPKVMRGSHPLTDSLFDDCFAVLQQELERCQKVLASTGSPPQSSEKPAIAVKYPKWQIDILMDWMIERRDNPYPQQDDIRELSKKTNLSSQQIVNWTTNVRKRNMKATCQEGKKPHHFIDFLFLAEKRESESLRESSQHKPPQNVVTQPQKNNVMAQQQQAPFFGHCGRVGWGQQCQSTMQAQPMIQAQPTVQGRMQGQPMMQGPQLQGQMQGQPMAQRQMQDEMQGQPMLQGQMQFQIQVASTMQGKFADQNNFQQPMMQYTTSDNGQFGEIRQPMQYSNNSGQYGGNGQFVGEESNARPRPTVPIPRPAVQIPRPAVRILPRGLGPVTEPNQNDVLCGRGGGNNSLAGNVQFRDIINDTFSEYISANRLGKAHVALGVVQHIREMEPAGRFLREDGNSGIWWDVGDHKAMDKVKRAWRDGAPGMHEALTDFL